MASTEIIDPSTRESADYIKVNVLQVYTVYITLFYKSKIRFMGSLWLGGWDSNTIYNSGKVLGLTTSNNITFNTGTTLANYATRMTIDTSGNIGIGTAPSYSNAEISFDTYITGQTGITGNLSLYSTSGGIGGNLNCRFLTCKLYAVLIMLALVILRIIIKLGWNN